MNKYLFSIFAILAFSIVAAASGPSLWSVDTRAEVLRGDARGVSIDQNGAITPAPRLSEVFKTEQSYIWSSAVDVNGNIFLGTGGEGKIFKIDPSGTPAASGVIAKSAELSPGASAILTATLAPGSDELVRLMPGHYAAGQHLAFAVTG